ncbi:MAG: polynucleotide adenylyltransferase PcnB [Bdellovibrionota bacterium]|nr:MAG: polynucleotide adenylyltransferase PcnB [Bdellovibrionota bacterium]
MNESELTSSDTTTPRIYSRSEHSISRNNIDPDALKIMYRLLQHGFKAYVVGGGVRDLLLGKTPKDFDIATDARPRQIKSLFRNSRIIGRRFKLVHVFFSQHKIIEVSTFRDFQDEFEAEDEAEGGPSNGALRDNKFGTEATDARRRDITINGLFYDLSTFSIIDYVGGVEDLRHGLIRVIGDPRERFLEDPVRLVRVVRHAARTGFRIEQQAREAMLDLHGLVEKSVAVRLYVELQKDLTSGYCLKTLRMMEEMQLLGHFLPELTGSVLAANTYLSRSLFRFDQFKKEEGVSSCTAVLALLALTPVLREPSSSRLIESLHSRMMIKELVSNAFPRLAVPRRERERLAELLLLWFALRSPSGRPPRLSSIAKAGCFPDLMLFARVMETEAEDAELLAELESLAHNAPPRERSGPPQKRRRRRSRRRAPEGDTPEFVEEEE